MKIEDNDGMCCYLRDSFIELSSLMTALKTAKDLKDNFNIQVPISGFLEVCDVVLYSKILSTVKNW